MEVDEKVGNKLAATINAEMKGNHYENVAYTKQLLAIANVSINWFVKEVRKREEEARDYIDKT